MEKGDVLVAETTSPEIIHACKKASAIITNQGGMLSHAAIVSRELDIPCVIGTDKDVLENIKTGDLIEVDAKNGVINVIHKAQR
jgi:pyruvate,water dikinase